MGAACFCLCFSGLSQRNVNSTAIFSIALADDHTCSFQFLDDFADGSGLDTQLLGQFPLGHMLRLAEDLENKILTALTIESAMSYAAQSAQQ